MLHNCFFKLQGRLQLALIDSGREFGLYTQKPSKEKGFIEIIDSRIGVDMEPNIIKQDIEVAIKAIEKDDFVFVNMIGNRIMSNLLIEDKPNLMILGFFLKEVGVELRAIKKYNENKLKDACDAGKKFLKTLSSIPEKNKIDIKELWEKYFEYENTVRKFIPSEIETSIYKENLDFTRKATQMLIKYLDVNRELLLKEDNQLLKGILNELSRIINSHGAERADLAFYLVMHSLDAYYEYLLYSEITTAGKISNKEIIRSKIYPYIDRIVKIFSNLEPEFSTCFLTFL